MTLNGADIDQMNFQNPTSMPSAPEIKQPSMLMCQLKEYQLKGLNWLANLYEQVSFCLLVRLGFVCILINYLFSCTS